jgi:hypothetical protein
MSRIKIEDLTLTELASLDAEDVKQINGGSSPASSMEALATMMQKMAEALSQAF